MFAKEPPSQRTTTDQMNGQTTYRQEGRTANIGLPAMAGRAVNSAFVHLINFRAMGQLSASKPPLRQAKNRYKQGKETQKPTTVSQ